MPRTTLNIDSPVLSDLRKLQKKEKKTLGTLVSELLVHALAMRRSDRGVKRTLRWHSMDMGTPRHDLEDRHSIWTLLDAETHHD